jgi:hypothetical protein
MINKLIIILILLSPVTIFAQEWQLDLSPSHSAGEIGGLFPSPISNIINFSTLLDVKNSSRFGIEGGPSFSDNYYFLIPEKESAFYWHLGLEWTYRSLTNQIWQPIVPEEPLITNGNFTTIYTQIYLNQVLLGDKYHMDANLNITLNHKSSYNIPLETENDKTPFFLHTPEIGINIVAVKDQFWSVLGFNSTITLPLEMGHANDTFWSFLGLAGGFNLRLPLFEKYLYFDWDFTTEMVLHNFTPNTVIPNYIYSTYGDKYSGDTQLNLKSRIFEFEILYPMAVELGAFISTTYGDNTLSIDELTAVSFKTGAYGEFKIEIPYLINLAVQIGAVYDLNTSEFGVYLNIK